MKRALVCLLLALVALALALPASADFAQGLQALKSKDYENGFRLLAPLARRGDARAQYCLGLMYQKGYYVPQSHDQAVAWYKLAAKQGHSNAQNNLGLQYKRGQGVPQDYVQAYIWFETAAAAGNKKGTYNRDKLSVLMTGQQLAQARNQLAEMNPDPSMADYAPGSRPAIENDASSNTTSTNNTTATGSKPEQHTQSTTTPKAHFATPQGELRVSTPQISKTADIQKITNNFLLALNVYDRLMECVPAGTGHSAIVPGLAEKYTISTDGKKYVFTLRKGVRFHNGDELTAQDVVYTFDRMLATSTRARHADIFEAVLGAKERMDGRAGSTKGLKATGKYSLTITLTKPFAPFLALLASPQASIYNKSFTQKLGQNYGLSPATTCGTGPFKLSEHVLTRRQTLEANTAYYLGPPALSKVRIRKVSDAQAMRRLFEQGELDVLDLDHAPDLLPYFHGNTTWKQHVRSIPRVGVFYVSMNQGQPPFNDIRVRRAFQLAVDRQRILQNLFFGQGTLVGGILPKGLVCYDSPPPAMKYDPVQAKKLLIEAGHASGVEVTLLQVEQWPDVWGKINALIKESAEKAGFRVRIQSMDEAEYFITRNTGKAGAYAQAWAADFNDPDNYFSTFFGKKSTKKQSINYGNQDVINAIQKARAMTDLDARCALYHKLEKTIVKTDAAWLPLFTLHHDFVIQPRVKHFPAPWNGDSNLSFFKARVE